MGMERVFYQGWFNLFSLIASLYIDRRREWYYTSNSFILETILFFKGSKSYAERR